MIHHDTLWASLLQLIWRSTIVHANLTQTQVEKVTLFSKRELVSFYKAGLLAGPFQKHASLIITLFSYGHCRSFGETLLPAATKSVWISVRNTWNIELAGSWLWRGRHARHDRMCTETDSWIFVLLTAHSKPDKRLSERSLIAKMTSTEKCRQYRQVWRKTWEWKYMGAKLKKSVGSRLKSGLHDLACSVVIFRDLLMFLPRRRKKTVTLRTTCRQKGPFC